MRPGGKTRAEQYPFVRLLPAPDFRDHVFMIVGASDAPLILFGVRVHTRIAKCRDAPGGCSRRCRAVTRASANFILQSAKIFSERRLALCVGDNFWRYLIAKRLAGSRTGG